MKQRDEILQKITELKAKAKVLIAKDGATVEEIQSVQKELSVLNEKLTMLDALNLVNTNQEGTQINETDTNKNAAEYKNAFYNNLKGQATTKDITVLNAVQQLSTANGQSGGYLIPADQNTKIIELKKAYFSFRDYIYVEPVTTMQGSRVVEETADSVPFVNLTEGQKISEVDAPKFVNIEWKIKDYGGFLPIPNNLIADSNNAIETYLNDWLARKSLTTENKVILDKLQTMKDSKVAVKTIDDLKDVINTKLSSIFKNTAKVFMNNDAFNHFAKLKDTTGRYLLETDPKKPTQKLIEGVPVVEVPNEIFKTTEQKATIFVGDLKSAVTMYDRQALSLLSTNVGGNAFLNNTTDIRAIIRFDVQEIDERAIVACELDFSTLTA